ncbi:MAG: efflux RND transporter periplasmic adaptor subunit, partial [Acetobacteraceae bacterium]|nr:efflux RND transporter periplasmic adaptor subunit [Acetobacteraceae bacterium]
KIALIFGVVLLLAVIVAFTVYQSQKNLVEVQTARAGKADLVSIVSGSGEIKPKTYANIGALSFGQITHLYVHEGDRVKQGQMLAQVDNIQPSANVAAGRANLQAARTDAIAAEAAYKTAVADIDRARADEEQKRFDYERGNGLYNQQLIAKADFDVRKSAYEASASGLQQAQARIAQTKAQLESANLRVAQANAQLTATSDVLHKTSYAAPYDGIVTSLPVREGETVVMGIQNSPGSTLMTVADMSVVTAEIKVDETDIISVKMGQPAEVTIDAVPGKVFKAHVTEIGDNAMLRSTGVSTSQSTSASEEAKDFKVVVTIENPPENLRPGLSATAKVTTATRNGAMAIPIQALTVRNKRELEAQPASGSVQAAAPPVKSKDEDQQGVFVIRNHRAVFVPVKTGIAATTENEVLSGLNEGDEVVTGSYRVLRSLRNKASVKVDNSVPAAPSQ